jgi:hypothetical protein
MKIAKKYAGLVCAIVMMVCAQEDVFNKEQEFGQALYERACNIVNNSNNSETIANLVHTCIADQEINDLLSIGKHKGYTLVELLQFAKKAAQENGDEEVEHILSDMEEEVSKSWISKHPVLLLGMAATALVTYFKRDLIAHLFARCLQTLGIRAADQSQRLPHNNTDLEVMRRQEEARLAEEQARLEMEEAKQRQQLEEQARLRRQGEQAEQQREAAKKDAQIEAEIKAKLEAVLRAEQQQKPSSQSAESSASVPFTTDSDTLDTDTDLSHEQEKLIEEEMDKLAAQKAIKKQFEQKVEPEQAPSLATDNPVDEKAVNQNRMDTRTRIEKITQELLDKPEHDFTTVTKKADATASQEEEKPIALDTSCEQSTGVIEDTTEKKIKTEEATFAELEKLVDEQEKEIKKDAAVLEEKETKEADAESKETEIDVETKVVETGTTESKEDSSEESTSSDKLADTATEALKKLGEFSSSSDDNNVTPTSSDDDKNSEETALPRIFVSDVNAESVEINVTKKDEELATGTTSSPRRNMNKILEVLFEDPTVSGGTLTDNTQKSGTEKIAAGDTGTSDI